MSGIRPRIARSIKDEIFDKDAFVENCSTKKAKYHIEFIENSKTEIWIDKHYWDRILLEDRDGIEIKFVEPLVIKSFKHLLYYCLKHKDFSFINHPPPKSRNIRVVLRQLFNNKEPLNVAVEYHFLKLNSYEVTIKTAMSVEQFDLGDGQYLIEFNENESTLYSFRKRQLNEIDKYYE